MNQLIATTKKTPFYTTEKKDPFSFQRIEMIRNADGLFITLISPLLKKDNYQLAIQDHSLDVFLTVQKKSTSGGNYQDQLFQSQCIKYRLLLPCENYTRIANTAYTSNTLKIQLTKKMSANN